MENKITSILIVEDDEFMASLLTFLFERAQFAVQVVADGRAALARIDSQSPPDAVVLDILLPYVNGMEVLERLRQQPLWQRTPVLMLSAKDGAADVAQALSLGADDYLTKPFDPQELLARVQRCLQRSRT